MNTELVQTIDWEKISGLVPTIIQDYLTGSILMLGYMNKESLMKTIDTGTVWFYSRSKGRLWMKGEESGNTLAVKNISLDCDMDTLLVQAQPAGPTCHTGETSCFTDAQSGMLDRLFRVIQDRKKNKPAGSYTTSLFNDGLEMICAKVEEESLEVIQAAKQESDQRVIEETSDVIYHLQVLLAQRNVQWNDVLLELDQRSE